MTASLAAWVSPQHLETERIEQYRQQMAEHPARLLVIEDFLQREVADTLHRFLSEEAEYDREHGLYSVEGAVDEGRWEAAPESDRFFRLGRLSASPQEFRFSSAALAYLRLRQSLMQDEARDFFAAVSGLALAASDDFGVHAMRSGDFLKAHSDDNRNRRLALVLYLSPDWLPSYGGALEMTDRHGDVSVVYPTYNSLVVFDVLAGTTHLVAPVSEEAGSARRLTIGGWYQRAS